MNTTLQNSFYKDAHNSVKLMDALTSVHLFNVLNNTAKGLRNFFSKIVMSLVAFLSLLLLTALFSVMALTLKFFIRRLKNAPAVDIRSLTSKEYKELRLHHDKLSKDLAKMNTLSNINIKQIPFLLRFFHSQVVKAKKVLEDRCRQNEVAFASLNSSLGTYKGFRAIPEQELWDKRTTAYEYLI